MSECMDADMNEQMKRWEKGFDTAMKPQHIIIEKYNNKNAFQLMMS